MLIKLFATILLLVTAASSYAEISVVDDLGYTVTLTEPAKRIVSLSPGTTELIYNAGGLKYLKGVVSYSDFPKEAKRIPQVGSYNSIDIEKIVALAPDLIVAWDSGNPPLQLSKLKKLGLTIYLSEPRDFDDIPSSILRLGKLMGSNVTAKKNANEFIERLASLKRQYPKAPDKKSTFIQIWNQPLMSISGEHLISKIVEQCNGKNIFHDTAQLTISLDVETIIQHDPDVIIVTRQGKLGDTWLSRWKKWEFMTAVKSDQLYAVNPDFVVRHTPRILDGIEQVCKLLHSTKK